LTCSFCHTGTQRLVRNLTAQEIIGQLIVAREKLGDFPGRAPLDGGQGPAPGSRFVSNIVFMGMGEPLYNYENVRDAVAVMSVKDLLQACRTYPGASNARRITFEYVMLKGVNDSPAEARELVRLLKGVPAKINLIPFNVWPGAPYECSDWATIERFSDIVFNAGYASPVRTPRGRDILAACGQLKSETEKLRARALLSTEP
jgi:23S rRNA (adenine2503-C2)-methyltransferase